MKFAILDNKRIEATESGKKAICPICGNPVTAKCGEQRINHWAHLKNCNCSDKWFEKETFWHRKWKNYFPEEWQEKIFEDKNTKEKHIADVYTNNNLVLEFQHSYVSSEERQSRENFYNNMFWIVDGTRLKNDKKRFDKNFLDRDLTYPYIGNIVYRCKFSDKLFPKNWLSSKVPIFFDFYGFKDDENEEFYKNYLFCLYKINYIIIFSRCDFISMIKENKSFNEYFNKIDIKIEEDKKIERQRKLKQERDVINKINALFNHQRFNQRRNHF